MQGSCADGLKLAIRAIVRRLLKGAQIILSVHDELLILCNEADGPAIAKMAQEEMIRAYGTALGSELLRVLIVFDAKPIPCWK